MLGIVCNRREADGRIQRKLYGKKQEWHRQQANLPIKEKMRILLELQKHDLPLLATRRPLKWYEKP